MLVNPNGRTDGYTNVLTADQVSTTLTVVSGLSAADVADAVKIRCEFDIVMAAADALVAFRPNGSTTDQHSCFTQLYAGGATEGSGPITLLEIASPNEATTTQLSGWFELTTKTGALRRYYSESVSYATATPRAERRNECHGFWIDTSTALSSIVIATASSATCKIGSRFRVTLIG